MVFNLREVTCFYSTGTNRLYWIWCLPSFCVAAVYIPSARVCSRDGRTRLAEMLLPMAGKTPLLCMRFRIGPPDPAKVTCTYGDLSTELAPALSEREGI